MRGIDQVRRHQQSCAFGSSFVLATGADSLVEQTRPHRISRAWSTALIDEWTVQASIELEFGLPISVMTLDPRDTKAQAKSQVGFIDLFAKPLFVSMAGVVDGAFLRSRLSCTC